MAFRARHAVDPQSRMVTLGSGARLPYDPPRSGAQVSDPALGSVARLTLN